MVAILDKAAAGPVTPLAFSTTAVTEIREELHKSVCPLIDFFDLHMERVESILGAKGIRVAARLHGMGDVQRYNTRMQAVEFAIEHDDGQSMRALDKADVILLAPSRCGKTPTTMYLALQHGLFVANYPLVEEDFASADLPRPVEGSARPLLRHHHDAGPAQPGPATSGGPTPATPRWSSAPTSCAGPRRCTAAHRIPMINSSAKSVEEMSTVILQHLNGKAPRMSSNVVWFADIGLADLEQVGGKNSSLGEMVRNLSSAGVRVPDGFATTADAYRRFIGETGLAEMISGELAGLDTDDVQRLAEVGEQIRTAVVAQPFPADLEADIRTAYAQLAGDGRRAVVRGAVQRDGGGPAGRLVRRPAGDLPERPGHRGHPAGDPGGLRLALQRPGHRLPGAPSLRARGGGPVGRRAADGALRPRRRPG